MSSVRAALAWSFVERYALMVLSLVSYVLIARLLTPAEIGIYSVTAALVGIAQVIRDFGVGNYLIQERDLDTPRLETAFGFSLLAGCVMFVLAFLAAPWIAGFYGDPEVASILRVICLNFILLPFCSIALGMLRRTMRFDRLLAVNLAGGVAGFVATLGLAMLGFGPKCLAWGTVGCNAVTAIGAWWALVPQHRPHRPRLVAWRDIVAYGRQSTFAGIVVTAAMDINDLVVGKVLGFAPVAILNRAMGLMNLFQRDLMGAARNVAFPAFAEAHRDGKSLEPIFVYSFAIVTGAGWPFFGFLALFPLESLRLLAGTQWDAAAPLVLVFAAAGALICTATLTQTLVLAVGRVDLASRADIIVAVLRVAAVACAALVFRSLMAVALAFLASFALAVPIFFAFKHRCLPNDWSMLVQRASRSLMVTIASLLLPGLVSLHLGLGRSTPLSTGSFLLVCLLAFVGWVLALRWCGHPVASDPIYRKLMGRFRLNPSNPRA